MFMFIHTYSHHVYINEVVFFRQLSAFSRIHRDSITPSPAVPGTPEKASALVNRLVERFGKRALSDVGLVVLDELHTVSEESRGYRLEILLAKLSLLGGGAQVRLVTSL